jgi:hypothetical protein
MEPHGRANTPLRYRFASLDQAHKHVRKVDGRTLFFYRDEKLSILPYAPVCLEWAFETGEPARLVHGWVLSSIEGSGSWIELLETRSLRDLAPTEYTRRTQRMGCDVLVQLVGGKSVQTARMLDVSEGGGRFAGIAGLSLRQHVDLRILAPDRLTFFDLSAGYVSWAELEEFGVQFDRLDSLSRMAVARLVSDTEELWARAWEGFHASFCCGESGVVEPEPPKLRAPENPLNLAL